MAAVRLARVSKVYGSGNGRRVALSDCSFECHNGEIVGVIGPNGAGKTTLLRLMAGETASTSGELTVAGHRVGSRAARRAVGYVGDPPLLPGELSGVEWLKYLAGHRASHPRERTALLQWAMELADVEEFAGRRISECSRGMVQRLALATAALAGSTALLLDEALSGIDPLLSRRLRGTLTNLAATGRVIIVASHDLAVLERVATRVLVLWRGRLVSDVSIARLATERVAELSLSGSCMSSCARLLDRFEGATRTDDGVAIPLTGGVTIEQAMAACRAERIPVAASRIRYRALEDVLVRAEMDARNQT
jgi:ABC-type multidrug transport system ATPase subunit